MWADANALVPHIAKIVTSVVDGGVPCQKLGESEVILAGYGTACVVRLNLWSEVRNCSHKSYRSGH